MKEVIMAAFPRTVSVTQEIIDKACIYNAEDCVGYHTLQKGLKEAGIKLPEGSIVSWGDSMGSIHLQGGKHISVETADGTNMMGVKHPREIKLQIYKTN